MTDTKTCTICGQTKPLDGFYRNSACVGGYANQCKECVLERGRRMHRQRHVPIPDGPPRVCGYCGKSYAPITRNQKYCYARCRMRGSSQRDPEESYNLHIDFRLTIDPWRGVNEINLNPFPAP